MGHDARHLRLLFTHEGDLAGRECRLEGGQRCDFRVGFSRHDAVEAIPAIPFLADEVEPVLLQELDLVRPQQGSVDGLPRLSRERQLLGIEGLGGPAGKQPQTRLRSGEESGLVEPSRRPLERHQGCAEALLGLLVGQTLEFIVEMPVRHHGETDAAVAVPAHVLTDQRSAIGPSDWIAGKLESIGFPVRLGPRLGHHLVASNAGGNAGITDGSGLPSLSRARAGKAVARDIRRNAVVAAVGIAAAVEICIPDNLGIHLRKRHIREALQRSRSFGPLLGQELALPPILAGMAEHEIHNRKSSAPAGSSDFPRTCPSSERISRKYGTKSKTCRPSGRQVG